MPRIIVKNLPENVKESDLKEQFEQIGAVTDFALKKNPAGRLRRFAFVGYKTPEEAEEAVQRFHKTFIRSQRLHVELASDLKAKEKRKKNTKEKPKKTELLQEEVLKEVGDDPDFQEFLALQQSAGQWVNDLPQKHQTKREEKMEEDGEEAEPKETEEEKDEDDVSGRLFVRNLSYSCTEEDLKVLFEQHGPVSQVHLPVDSFTKKVKGFGFVTYLFPDHAQSAIEVLDKTDFQGRLIHIMHAQPAPQPVNTHGLNFKQKREAERKAAAGKDIQSWNTLFLGSDAVAEAIAKQYNSTKAAVLDSDGSDSLAVRLALGETQLVQSTRQFLEKNGVSLDAFVPGCPRSSQVILVKNLPADTTLDEVKPLFSGATRVLMPPGGLAALVEYKHPAEARQAFKSRAYTKFKHLPLYLEWAPKEALKAPEPKKEVNEKTTSKLCVRNVAFEAKIKEIEELFKVFGELRSVRLPKKVSGGHRGFGFVHFVTKEDAKRAFDALSGSTHLYGRRLVLEWSSEDSDSTKTQDTKSA